MFFLTWMMISVDFADIIYSLHGEHALKKPTGRSIRRWRSIKDRFPNANFIEM
jgi:hypothetical protein